MLSKQQKYLQRKWIQGRFDLVKTARHMGYKGARVTKGMEHIRNIMQGMNITIL